MAYIYIYSIYTYEGLLCDPQTKKSINPGGDYDIGGRGDNPNHTYDLQFRIDREVLQNDVTQPQFDKNHPTQKNYKQLHE